MKDAAPGAGQELRKIDEVEADPRKKPTAAWRRNEDIKNLREAFRRICGEGSCDVPATFGLSM
jgi:hypothetical protein